MGSGHGELCAQRWLVRSLQVACSGVHPCFQVLLGTARRFGVGMKRGVDSDAPSSSKRFDGSQEPRFVLPVRQDDFARHTPRCRRGPTMDNMPQFRRAIVIAIEHDQDCIAAAMQCQVDGSIQSGLLDQLVARALDRPPDFYWPSLCFGNETSQEYRHGDHVAVAFHDRLDVHVMPSSSRATHGASTAGNSAPVNAFDLMSSPAPMSRSRSTPRVASETEETHVAPVSQPTIRR